MKRHLLAALALAAVVLLGSCSDGGAPAPTAPGLRTADATTLTCPTPAGLATLANTVFGAGSPSAKSVSAKVDKIVRLVAKGDKVGAKQAAFDAVKFVLQAAGKSRFPKNDTAVNIALNSLVQGIFCLAGITMPDPASSPSGAALVYPTDAPQVITTGDGLGGVSLPANPVSEPTLITITPITDVFAPGAGPLHTKLDQYPGYYEFKKQSPTDPPLLPQDGDRPAADALVYERRR